jgi:trehalose/maltose transport system substrate-binding protein
MNLKSIAGGLLLGALLAGSASAATLSIVNGDTGGNLQWLRGVLDEYQKTSGDTVNIVPMPSSTTDQFGQYKLWLAAGNSDIDVYQTDVIWAPQLADQFVDLSTAAKDVSKDFFPSIIESQTVNGKLVAIPFFTDAPALFYRKDLLEKYNLPVPKTWTEMASEAKTIQDGERAAGNKDFWGFVFQGNAYEGLTCDALEWVKSYGGGQIVEPDGSISINNPKAAAALEEAKSWVNTISPPGVLSYGEEESRGVWQLGNAAFMRNWPYAYALGNAADSPIKGKFDVSTLPVGAEGDKPASTLGGWNLAVSKYSKNPDAAWVFMQWATCADTQALITVLGGGTGPTRKSVYDDPRVKANAKVGAGTTRHLPVVRDTIANYMGSEPDLPQWAEISSDTIPVALGKYFAGQSGSAKETLDGIKKQVDDIVAKG